MADMNMKQGTQQTTQKDSKPSQQNMQGKNRGQTNPAINSEKERSKDYAKVSGSKR